MSVGVLESGQIAVGFWLTAKNPMNRYLTNRLFKIGFWLFILGCGPLLAIMALAGIGLWPDPNPNPIGPGLLAFFTFWPSVICMVIGALRVKGKSA